MVITALGKYKNVEEASKHLGITTRAVFRLIKRWEIDWNLPEINEI